MTTMDPEIKAKWQADLLSDQYPQGTGRLAGRDKNGTWRFCCLAVLCEQAVRAGIITRKDQENIRVYAASDEDVQSLYLPHAVVEWAGLPNNNPRVTYQGMTATLSEFNDELGRSFPQIAAAIGESL